MKRAILPLAVALFGLLSLGAKGCQIVVPPVTPATPPPADTHVPVCDGAAGKVSECWHHPPEGWRWNCAGGAPTVSSPAECPSAPKPTGCPIIEDDDAARVDQTQEYAPDYGSGILALQARHPDWFTFDEYGHWQAKRAGDEGSYPTPPAVDAFRAQFYRELGAQFVGLCAQVIGDELHVFDPKKSPIISERYKSFEYGGGREMQKPYMGRTRAAGSPGPAPTPKPGPTPTPPPGPVDGCPAGTPAPGQYVISCHVKPANPAMVFCDSTPKVIDRDYCAPAVVCPYRGGEGSDSRIACERALAWPVWTGADQRGDNPFSADAARGAHVKVCSRDNPGTCAEGDAP